MLLLIKYLLVKFCREDCSQNSDWLKTSQKRLFEKRFETRELLRRPSSEIGESEKRAFNRRNSETMSNLIPLGGGIGQDPLPGYT